VAPSEVLAIRKQSGTSRALRRAFVSAFLLGVFACSDGSHGAPSVVDSGQPAFDGGAEGIAEDAGAEGTPEDAGAMDSGGTDYCAEAGSRGAGTAFSDLYRDFFGPSGQASCSARSICHVPGGTGMQTSGGYVCSPDEPSCWASMTSTIVPDGGSTTPEETMLYRALRKAPPTPGSGPMPRNSTFAFCPDDLTRLRSWIVAGAPGP
jgi:hypothetical protein